MKKRFLIVLLLALALIASVGAYSYTLEDSNIDVSNLGNIVFKNEHPSATARASAAGQAFNTSSGFTLGYVDFYLSRTLAPTANLTAALYKSTGAMGTNAKPTGNALVWSEPYNSSNLAVFPQWISFNFSYALYWVNASSEYCIALTVNTTNVDDANFPRFYVDLNTGHYGNNFNFKNNVWNAGASDAVFRLYSIKDSENPQIIYLGFNSTLNNQTSRFQFNLTDNMGLSHLVFGWNNSGTWINYTQSLSGTSQIAYYTATVNETIGVKVEYQAFWNDTSDNWASIPLHYFIVNDPAKAVDFLGYLILAPIFVICVGGLIYWASRKK